MKRLLLITIVLIAMPVNAQVTKLQNKNSAVINPATDESVVSIRSAITSSPLTVVRQNGATASLTNVTTSTTSTTLLSASSSHKGRFIFNDTATSYLYVSLGSSATTTSFTFKLAPYETLIFDPGDYSGVISGILDTGIGTARVTGITQ